MTIKEILEKVSTVLKPGPLLDDLHNVLDDYSGYIREESRYYEMYDLEDAESIMEGKFVELDNNEIIWLKENA